MPSLADAIAVTGAGSGAVLASQTISVGPLTGPQKTALLAFVTSLGVAVPSANIFGLMVTRQAGAPTIMYASLTGIVQPANATTALTNRTQYDDIVGVVP